MTNASWAAPTWSASSATGHRAGRQRRARQAGVDHAQGDGGGHAASRPCACCRPTPGRVLDLVQEAAAGAHPAPPGQGGGVPDVPRRVPGPGHRPGPGEGLRAQRHRVRRRRQGPGAAVPRGCTAASSTSSPRRPRENVKVLAAAVRAGQRHRRAPADVRLRAEEGLRRLRRRPRRRAGRRPHLRRRRVPDEAAQGRRHRASTPSSPATCPRRSPTTRRATCGPRTSA